MKANTFFVAFNIAVFVFQKKKKSFVSNKKQAVFSKTNIRVTPRFFYLRLFQTSRLLISKNLLNPFPTYFIPPSLETQEQFCDGVSRVLPNIYDKVFCKIVNIFAKKLHHRYMVNLKSQRLSPSYCKRTDQTFGPSLSYNLALSLVNQWKNQWKIACISHCPKDIISSVT